MAREGSDRTLAKGLVEDAGGTAILHYEVEGKKPVRDAIGAFQHRAAVEKALALMTDPDHGVIPHKREIGAVGHRIVHGGERFHASVLIDDGGDRGDRGEHRAGAAAQPRQPPGHQAAKAALPDAAAVAVFDTAFHPTLPAAAFSTPSPTSSTSATASAASAFTAPRTASSRRGWRRGCGPAAAPGSADHLPPRQRRLGLRAARRPVGRYVDGLDAAGGAGDGHPLRRPRSGARCCSSCGARSSAPTRSTP